MRLSFVFAFVFSLAFAQSPAQPASVAPAAAPAQPAPAPAANPTAPAQPATNSTAPAVDPAQTLMTCQTPHSFTKEEIKMMNQIFGIMILLLQYQLFVNDDKSGEQETYNQLLPMFRTVMSLFKGMK